MNSRESFLARPDVGGALDELFGECFARLEESGNADQKPDVREFLQERGIEVPPDSKLDLHHAIDDTVDLEAAAQPLAIICDENGTKGRTQCEKVKGKIHCYWVCP